jgi:hypothetical protein
MKLLLLFTVMITAAINDTSGVDYMKSYIISYMHSITNVAITPPKPPKEY